jgi:hypothetical protein
MKSSRKIGIFIFGLGIAGIAVATYFLLKKEKKAKVAIPVQDSDMLSGEKENISESSIDNTQTSTDTKPVEVRHMTMYDIPRPTWYTQEMEKKFRNSYQGYMSGGDAMKQKYKDWIAKWPGEAFRVDTFDDYCIESALQDIHAAFSLNFLQLSELRRFYGVGRDRLLPKDPEQPKPEWLNKNDMEYHMWWYFNYYYNEQNYGGIKESFYKGLDQMAHDNGINMSDIEDAKQYYSTSQVI